MNMIDKSKILIAIASAGLSFSVVNAAEKDASEIAPEGKIQADLGAAPEGVYVSDNGHAYISFSYDHQGYSKPILRWRSWTSELNWNPDEPEASTVSVEIDVASIDSGVDKFDDHLKASDFFDVEKYSTITFVSTAIERTGDTTGTITGDLTVKDITKPVVLDVVFNKAGAGRGEGTYKVGFSGKTTLKRSEFGVGNYVPFVGDNVVISIEVEYNNVK